MYMVKNSSPNNGGKQNSKPKNVKWNVKQEVYYLQMMLLYYHMTLAQREKTKKRAAKLEIQKQQQLKEYWTK